MLAISLAALLLVGAPHQASTIPKDTDQDHVSATDSTQLDSSKSEKPPTRVLPDADPAVMNQPLKSSPGMPVNGSKNAMSDPAIQKKMAEARARNEAHRQAAIQINEMAANIHSEKDARALVDAIAEVLTNHKHLLWAAVKYRHRVAHAEFEAVSDPSNLISDQRVAEIWNEYAREIDAPEEALVTQEEVHRLRAGRYRMSKMMWLREYGQSIWTMPSVHAVAENGVIAEAGRPLEMLDVLNHLYNSFPEMLFARDRLREQNSDANATLGTAPRPVQISSSLVPASRIVSMPSDPIRPAEARYQQEHGENAYRQLLQRLFDELFPPE